jgi:hypothetical protein
MTTGAAAVTLRPSCGVHQARILEKVLLGSGIRAAVSAAISDMRSPTREQALPEDLSLAASLAAVITPQQLGAPSAQAMAALGISSSCDYPAPLLAGVHLAARMLEGTAVRAAAVRASQPASQPASRCCRASWRAVADAA